MDTQLTLPGLAVSPDSKVVVHLEITSPVNITAFAARQRANRFLLAHVGDQVAALEPEIVIGNAVQWRMAVQYAPSRLGPLGVVGHLLVDAQTGEVSVADDRTIEDLELAAEALYERATFQTRA